MIDIAQNKTSKPLANFYTVKNGMTIPLEQGYAVVDGKTKEVWTAFNGVLYESGKENVTLSFPDIANLSQWERFDCCGYNSIATASSVCDRQKNTNHIYLKALRAGGYMTNASVYSADLLNVKKYNTAKITFVNLLKQSYSYVKFIAYTDSMYSPLKSNMVAVKNYDVNSAQTLSLDISSIDECRFLFSCEVQGANGGTNNSTGASVKITKIWLE